MEFMFVSKEEKVATVTLNRGKVNALNEGMVEELYRCLSELERDHEVNAVILTGNGKFFSFGFDIPELLSYSREDFARFLTRFTELYTALFLFPKPVIGALNGHTIAGGCMLATACDYRIMVSGKAKIALNEIGFGSSVLAGSVEMLKFCVGPRTAASILYTGAMYSADKAMEIGLIDRVSSEDDLTNETKTVAGEFAGKDPAAFGGVKGLLRKPVAGEMIRREKDSINKFVDIWYSEKTWKNLKEIKIY